LAQNTFFNPTDSMFVIDQIAESSNKSTTISANIVYTEPLGEKGKYGSIRINYTPSIVNSETEKVTNNFDDNTQSYSRLDSILSNSFLNNVMSQRVGFMYRMKYKKAGVSVGLDGEHAALRGSQTFPQNLNVNQTFENLLPFARLKFDFSKTKVLRMIYRTGTNIPNIDQLQNVVDNSNPLNIRAGNPDLTQEYQHGLTFRYNQTNADKGTVFFAFANASHETNMIGNATLIAASDTLVDGIEILRGARYTRPQNIGNRQVITSLANYGFALTKLKSNINVNGGVNWVRSPGLINEVENFSNNTSFNSGVVVASNISEKVDFTLTYSASYHWVRNSIQTELNNNFLTQSTGAKINLLPYKGFVLSTDLVYRNFSGLGEGFNQSFALMNAGLGYKFLKNNAAEIRLTTFDLFNQNNSIARLVEDTYIEDRITQVLTRYYMLTFTYNNRKYKG
jgi:hypothetical protein